MSTVTEDLCVYCLKNILVFLLGLTLFTVKVIHPSARLLFLFYIILNTLFSFRWGRRPCFLFSLLVLIVSSVLTSIVKAFWLFTVVRLFVGVGAIGLCISGVVYGKLLSC